MRLPPRQPVLCRVADLFMKKNTHRFCLLDYLLLAACCVLPAFFAWRIWTGAGYDWQWHVIWQYFFRHDAQAGWVPNLLVQGLLTTIRLSIWATLLAVVFGTLAGLARVSRSRLRRMLARTYVESVRNLPPLVLVFIFYFFVSSQVMPATGLEDALYRLSPLQQRIVEFLLGPLPAVSAFTAGVFTLAIYEGAYIAEIVRAGVESVPRGQWEASASLGFGRFDMLRLVIFPQALKVIIPPLAGQFISTIKDSAIVSVISVQELTFQGLELMASTFRTFEVWTTIALLYLMLTLFCSLLARKVEARLRWRA